MTRNQIEAFEVLEKQMRRIADSYLSYKLFSKNSKMSQPGDALTKKVEKSFMSLTEFEKSLLNKEFFYQDYDGWWKSILNEEHFLFLKRKAIFKFLEEFYHE